MSLKHIFKGGGLHDKWRQNACCASAERPPHETPRNRVLRPAWLLPLSDQPRRSWRDDNTVFSTGTTARRCRCRIALSSYSTLWRDWYGRGHAVAWCVLCSFCCYCIWPTSGSKPWGCSSCCWPWWASWHDLWFAFHRQRTLSPLCICGRSGESMGPRSTCSRLSFRPS